MNDSVRDHRPEIDGLRALAIVPVVLHHAAPAVLPGGFVGVDVFFVISGYLICGIIAGELAAGQFSLIGFWERRLRRIVPALAAMLAGTGIAAWAILTPEDFQEFAKGLFAAAVFASNIHYARGTDYFAGYEGSRPLIHTWTLGVEEQFYLLFPLLMLTVWRWRAQALLPLVALIGAASLLLALWLAPRAPLAAFFLLPTRMWELMLGAAAALLPAPARPDGRLAAAGLGLILTGFAVIDPAPRGPGLAFLLPTIGTALVLRYAGGETLAGRVLAMRPLVGLGLISFGLYLWHQPLLALAQYQHFGPLPVWTSVAAVAAALGLAIASYRWIEQPVRTRKLLARPVVLAGVCAAALAMPLTAGGLGYLRLLLPQSGRLAQELDGLRPPSTSEDRIIPPEGPLRYVLYGDSHAGQFFDAAVARFGPGAVLMKSDCLAADGLSDFPSGTALAAACHALPDDLIRLVKARKISTVIWAQRWDQELYDTASDTALGPSSGKAGPALMAAITRLIDRLPRGTRVILVGNSPTAWIAGPQMENGWLRCRAYRNAPCPVSYPETLAEGRTLNPRLRGLAAADPRITYVDAAAPLCSGGQCWLVEDGRLNYWDGSHMTLSAATRVMAQIDPALILP
jgi:peptidoglycan/LPS O-acetylase OafA/YrhL